MGFLPRTTDPLPMKLPSFARSGGFVCGTHGQIGIIPDAEHSQALEFFALNVDIFFGVITAGLAYHLGFHIFLGTEFFFDLVFDRQTVAIPARHVFGLVTCQILGLDDNVLENFVQSGSEVNIAIGVGRAVMEHIGSLVIVDGIHPVISLDFFPELKRNRLVF